MPYDATVCRFRCTICRFRCHVAFMHVDIIDLTKVLDKNACLRDVAFGLKLLLLLIPDAQ